MRASNLIVLVLLGTIGCTKKPEPKTLISQWEKNQFFESTVERKLASSTNGQCLNDIFTVETLKEEVRALESKYANSPRVDGYWKHLDLSRLPVPQANFLKKFGEAIGDRTNPDAIDYSSCYDVPCIFNKIYNKEDHVAGYVHYLWFLKFGHMLSADNDVPKHNKTPGIYNGKRFKLSDYLYGDHELYSLWRLSLMLKAPHTTLSHMKEIQKIPRGERFEPLDYKAACGLAYNTGWILITDNCIRIDERNPDKGDLYWSLTHELNHQIDYLEGEKVYKAIHRSHQKDYLDISGLSLVEYRNEAGELVKEWKLREGGKLVSSYAGTNAQENFAESLSVFRVEGDVSQKKMDKEHLNFVSRNYYQDRFFDTPSQLERWIRSSESESSKLALNVILDCSKSPVSGKSNYFQKADFTSPPSNQILNCLSYHASDIAERIRAKVMISEPESCQTFANKKNKDEFNQLLKGHLAKSFQKYLNELEKDKGFIARYQKFQNQLNDKKAAREAFITCYEESEEQKCYENEVSSKIYESAHSLLLSETQIKEMTELYLARNPYYQVNNETFDYYQSFILSQQDMIFRAADDLWQSCLQMSHNDVDPPQGNLFTIGEGYMISSLYTCINRQLPSHIQSVVRDMAIDGLKVEHAKEEVILTEQLRPEFIFRLQDHYIAGKKKEYEEAVRVAKAELAMTKKSLVSSFHWIKNALDQSQVKADCEVEATKLVNFQPLFHLKRDLFKGFAEYSCSKVTESPEFKEWIEGSQDILSGKIFESLEKKVLLQATEQARICVEKYPVDNLFTRIRYILKRDACLFDEWPRIESRVIEEALKDPVISKFKVPRSELENSLASSRAELQGQVTKEQFKGFTNFLF